jgi:hypothetical protein
LFGESAHRILQHDPDYRLFPVTQVKLDINIVAIYIGNTWLYAAWLLIRGRQELPPG